MGNILSFQLLDVSYEIINNSPIINLWGRDANNKKILLIDTTFRPYFYLLQDKDSDPEKIKEEILSKSKVKSPIINIEDLKMSYIGRPAKALKVTTIIPESVREYREVLSNIEGIKDVLEADIRFSFRYTLDKNLYPMRWYKVDARPLEKRTAYRVDEIYEINGEITEDESRINVNPLDGLKIMAFDIEVYNPQRTPDPSKDPIILISIKFNDIMIHYY
jgi:DNA polymerase elongation subunit (family B)